MSTPLVRLGTPPTCLAVALAAALLGACSPKISLIPPGDGGTSDGGGDAAPSGDGGAYYLPVGYTLVPFLSDAPVRSFPAAGQVLQAGHAYCAVLETDAGRMVVKLQDTIAPITVNSFVWLGLHHFFDGLAFHRVVEGFVAQGGDPNSINPDPATWGSGDPGYSFGLEVGGGATYDGPGVVGMARTSDPNSNGSQFFITLAAAHNLDNQYTIFGSLVEGLDVLPKIVRGEPPAMPTRMQRVYIVERAP